MTTRLRTGKVPWEVIAGHLRTRLPEGVLLGPAQGEDAALVSMGDELWAVASDPISFTTHECGRLAVLVNSNDVAARGAEPRFFVAVLMLAPATATSRRVGGILEQIHRACRQVGAVLIGGHTEVTPGIDHDLVVGTMLGRVIHRPLTSSGLQPGHRVGLSKWAGLEGTAILHTEFADGIHRYLGSEAVIHPDKLFQDWLSVLPEARIAAACPAVSALHDVTEGGVAEALNELAMASGVALRCDRSSVPILEGTRILCENLGLDPLGLIGSGALLIGTAPEGAEVLQQSMKDNAIPFTWIADAVAGNGCDLARFPRDELLEAFSLSSIQAVLFDMDGTLIASQYDWPAIRQQLGVEGASIIDELNELDEPHRTHRWNELEAIERQASEGAELMEGVHDLLDLLARHGLPTALVTNNTDTNTQLLLNRFDLRFDVVLTRDCGLFKPSGAPLTEAMKLLGANPETTLAIGDSRYDLAAARDAGCSRMALVNNSSLDLQTAADLAFPDIVALLHHLRLVLG